MREVQDADELAGVDHAGVGHRGHPRGQAALALVQPSWYYLVKNILLGATSTCNTVLCTQYYY